MLRPMIEEFLRSKDVSILSVAADYLEDHPCPAPEKASYITRLRSGKVSTLDLLAIIEKYGTRAERKSAAKLRKQFTNPYPEQRYRNHIKKKRIEALQMEHKRRLGHGLAVVLFSLDVKPTTKRGALCS